MNFSALCWVEKDRGSRERERERKGGGGGGEGSGREQLTKLSPLKLSTGCKVIQSHDENGDQRRTSLVRGD